MTDVSSMSRWANYWSSVRRLLPTTDDVRAMRRQPLRDFTAGLAVATVALPLALAFGISSGLSAQAGLVTAIIAGIVAAVFGGSNLQVSGPTGAMAVVLLPIVAQHGPDGVLVVGLLAGAVLIALAALRAGRLMKLIPLPVVEGFTAGIALIIGLQQLPAALGVAAEGDKVIAVAVDAVRTWLQHPSWAAPLIAVSVATAMRCAARWRPTWPTPLLAVAVVTIVTVAADTDLARIGAIPRSLPAPSLPHVDLAMVQALLLPAVAVAALAALESLLSATVADGMTVGDRHDSDRELFGQGLANLASPLFGGMPATAAIARTAVNVRSGGRSRLAAVTHSVALLVVMIAAAPWVGEIPLAALAGVLIATSLRMVEVASLRSIARATRGDAAVLVLTAAATVIFDLVTAVLLGLLVAGIHALQQVARSARLDVEPIEHDSNDEDEQRLLDEHVIAFRLEGPLFFGAAHAFLMELTDLKDVRVVILRMSHLQTLDATGAAVLADTITDLERRGTTVLISGLHEDHRRILNELGALDALAHERHLFDTTPEAIAHARTHTLKDRAD